MTESTSFTLGNAEVPNFALAGSSKVHGRLGCYFQIAGGSAQFRYVWRCHYSRLFPIASLRFPKNNLNDFR